MNSKLLKWVLPAIAGLSVFLVYLRTLAPGVVGGDTGELVTVAYRLGVAHPPGYPLFTILAKLFTFIPYGAVAWRVNLLSAVCDAAAAVIILLAVRRWARNHWAGLLAAGLFAFSPLVWRYAVVGEVFALNNLIVALMVYLAVRYSEGRERKFAYLTAFVFGLGMSNHHICLFYGFPLMLWILITGRAELWTIRSLCALAGSFIAGLLPYVYLPLADTRVAAVSWGHTSTMNGFLLHVLRREYGTLQLGNKFGGGGKFFLGIRQYFEALPGQVFYVGLVLALIGLYGTIRRERRAGLAVAMLAGFCFYLIVFHALANLPFDDPFYFQISIRFWQQANLMVCVWAGLGFGSLTAMMLHRSWQHVLTTGLASLVVLAQATTNFRVEDQHLNTVVRDYGRELIRPLPPDALLLSKGDLGTNVLRYLQQCEGYRTDVRVLDRELLQTRWMKRLLDANYPDVSIPGDVYGPKSGGYDLRRLFDANAARFRMFIRSDYRESDRSWDEDYTIRPFGVVNQITSRHEPFEPYAYVRESGEALPKFDLKSLEKYPDGSWENAVLRDYWDARFVRSNYLFSYAFKDGNNRFFLEAGVAGLQDVVERFPKPQPWVFKTLGFAYSKLALYEPAYEQKMRVAWQRYLEMGPQVNDPDLAEIRRMLSTSAH